MIRTIVVLIVVALTVSAVHAERVTIPWRRNYVYTNNKPYSPDNKWESGRSSRFHNGAPEENSKIEDTGNLKADFIRPRGSVGPVPVVILMHGCTGLTKPVVTWANEKGKMLLDQGIGVLILDSFGPRNVTKTCGAPNYHWGWRRVEDAYSALSWLITNKHAIPDQVYVLGRSNGGSTAVMLATKVAVDGHYDKFAGSFAISPACDAMERFEYAIPVTIFTGDRDMANDPQLCLAINGKNSLVKTVLFKGVHHGFEDRTPTYVFNGWRMEYNSKADKDSMDQVLGIIQSAMQRKDANR